MDGRIAQLVSPQCFEVRLSHLFLPVGQLRGKRAQGSIEVAEGGRPPITDNGVDKSVRFGFIVKNFADLNPEVVGVRLGSVETV